MCAVQRDFVKFHGPITRPEDEPAQIFIHQDTTMHALFSKEAADSKEGMYVEAPARRVFALAYDGSSPWPEANLAWKLTELFIEERYGITEPACFQAGECFVAETKVRLGKNLPFVTHHFANQVSKINSKLIELSHLRKHRWDDYFLHGQAYCALFRAGPAKYRKAYPAFIAEFAETCDYECSVRKHLYSLDQNEMYKDMRVFLERKLRSVRAD